MNMTIDPNSIDWNKEDRESLVALIKFALNFASYVREIDPNIWKRAGEYASDFTKVDGISFNPSRNEEGGNESQKPFL